jgi:hypothetical protein
MRGDNQMLENLEWTFHKISKFTLEEIYVLLNIYLPSNVDMKIE